MYLGTTIVHYILVCVACFVYGTRYTSQKKCFYASTSIGMLARLGMYAYIVITTDYEIMKIKTDMCELGPAGFGSLCVGCLYIVHIFSFL